MANINLNNRGHKFIINGREYLVSKGGGDTPDFILQNVPIQDNNGNWRTYNLDTPLIVGKSYLIMWSTGKDVDTYPFATAFTLGNSTESVSLTAHGVTATLSISTTSLVGTSSNDYDTRLRKLNLVEIPTEYSDGLEY